MINNLLANKAIYKQLLKDRKALVVYNMILLESNHTDAEVILNNYKEYDLTYKEYRSALDRLLKYGLINKYIKNGNQSVIKLISDNDSMPTSQPCSQPMGSQHHNESLPNITTSVDKELAQEPAQETTQELACDTFANEPDSIACPVVAPWASHRAATQDVDFSITGELSRSDSMTMGKPQGSLLVSYEKEKEEKEKEKEKKKNQKEKKEEKEKEEKEKEEKEKSTAVLLHENNQSLFDWFWQIYPKRYTDSKKTTLTAFSRAVKQKDFDSDKFVTAVTNYVNDKRIKFDVTTGYQKGAAVYLNQCIWQEPQWQSKQLPSMKDLRNAPNNTIAKNERIGLDLAKVIYDSHLKGYSIDSIATTYNMKHETIQQIIHEFNS